MRYSRSSLTIMLASIAMAGAASAQKMPPARSAETLYEACQSEDRTNLMRCKAYLAGVADGMDFNAALQSANGRALQKAKLTLKPFAICHDQPWAADNLRQVYLSWAQANPDRMQGDQYIAVVDAFNEALPCQ